MNIILIGYRGSGKTSVGRLLAQRRGWRFVDTDALLVDRAGRSIAEIFQQDGEAAFRDLESAVVTEVVRQQQPQVISVGGGAILRPANRALLRASGTCVWLTASAATLQARIARDAASAAARPALTGRSAADEVREVLAAREPMYEAVADYVLDTTGLAVAEVARRVADLLDSAPDAAKD